MASTNTVTLLYGFPKNTEITEKKVDVEEALTRVRQPISSSELTLKVYGMYALPETWKAKIDDPAEQSYQYEVDCLGISVANGKIVPREAGEDEKVDDPKAKGAKAPAKGAKVEEPTAEELEKLEKEKAEKEERDKLLAEEWDKLDDETKHIRSNEDIFKQPCLKMQNLVAIEKVEALQQAKDALPEDDENQKQRNDLQSQIDNLIGDTNVGTSISSLNQFELVQLEENVRSDKGCWLRFIKMVPVVPEAEAAAGGKGGKAPAKGKGAAPTDELKPVFGKAWVDLTELSQPGATSMKQRVYLCTCAPVTKTTNEDGTVEEVEQTEFENVFEEAKSYVHIELTLATPVTPTIPKKPEPGTNEIVPVKQCVTWPYSKDPCDDFGKQVTLAVESLTKEYYNLFKEVLDEKGAAHRTEAENKERKDGFMKEFFYEINTQGKYHILKEKMKKSVVRIVKEHFAKQEVSIRGLKKDSFKAFYSELYDFLVSKMRETVKALAARKTNELHMNVVIPRVQGNLETEHIIEKTLGESTQGRYKRLANELETLQNKPKLAEQQMINLTNEMEGDQESLYEIAKFYMRRGESEAENAEKYMRDAYSFGMKNQSIALQYACILIQNSRLKEAYVILNSLAEAKYEKIKVYLLLQISATIDEKTELADKYKTLAIIEQLRQNASISKLGAAKSNPPTGHVPKPKEPEDPVASGDLPEVEKKEKTNIVEASPAFQNQRLSQNELDNLYLDLSTFLLDNSFQALSSQTISYIADKDSIKVKYAYIRSQMLNHNFEEAATFLEDIFNNIDPDMTDAYIQYGHCKFMLGKHDEALESYYKAIRVSNLKREELNDSLLLQRLGGILIQKKKWEDAKVIFEMCANKYENAYSYLNLGIACCYLGNYQDAENFLKKANILDTSNADVWGYMTLVMLNKGPRIYNAYQSKKQAIALQIHNNDLMYDVSLGFAKQGWVETARKTLEYTILTRATYESAKKKQKVQEFLLQVSKIHAEFLRQKEQNNDGYSQQADEQINDCYNTILIKSKSIGYNDPMATLLLRLYLHRIDENNVVIEQEEQVKM